MVQNTKKSTPDVVSAEMCERVAQREAENKERFWKVVQEIRARNADKDPDEVFRDVTDVVEAVRQERYEREQCATRGRPRVLAPIAI
ncbi:MAG: hypothetical protein H0T18_08545 [Chloroflexia bacterium]|nr:hypothetical protein [Chloroflexia bacterium]